MSKIYVGNEQIATSQDLEDKQDKLVSTVNIKTVQGNNILGEGDLHVARVDLADNLYSADSQIDSSEFIVRTAGGEASIETGEATLVKIDGHSTTPTHTPEVLTNSYTNVGRPSLSFDEDTFLITGSNDMDYTQTFICLEYDTDYNEYKWSWSSTNGGSGTDYENNMANRGIVVTGDIQVGDEIFISYTAADNHAVATFTTSYSNAGMTFDKDTWRSYVNTDGTYVFTYDDTDKDWKLNGSIITLSNYGITIIGTEHNNDYITIVYSKVDYGTISSTTPTKFISIGFNLFDYTTGFARVVGNADGQWYIVRGNYTSIEFSTSKTGTFTPITPGNYTVGSYSTDKGFPIYQDGWIKVTGGDDTTTMINLIWSGYMMTADYQEYHEDYINIPTEDADGTSLPTELRSVGTYSDELNFSLATWTVNIGRMAYTAENLVTLLESNPTWLEGVQYEWDNDYIYYLLSTPTVYTLSSLTSGIYDVDDFGIEEFQGTTIPAEGNILYGQNLVRKLTRDVLIIGQQTLTIEQKQQVWSNLGLEILGDQQF